MSLGKDAIAESMCNDEYTNPKLKNGGNKMITKPMTRPNASRSSAPAQPLTLAIPEKKFQAPRILLYAVEGWGKTTAGAFAPKAAILMARGENGYETLLGMGSVPARAAASVNTWSELLATLDSFLQADSLPFKTLVLDAMNGFERLCHEHVCQVEFNGDAGDKGFMSFHKGYAISVTHWMQFLNRLEQINQKGIMIMCLDHVQVKTHQNPLGADFDKYMTACHPKTMDATGKWADAILFGNYVTIVDTEKGKKKGKGIGGTQRVIYTQQCDAFQAKNRYNMPECIEIPDDHEHVWSTIWHWIYENNFNPQTEE